MTLRIRPLGRDRFYNRYFYLDNIGGAVGDGSGRLYIQNPSYADIRLILNRKPTELTGYGSESTQFFLELMKQQGFDEESEWLEHRLQEIVEEGEGSTVQPNANAKGWWMYYSRPEEVNVVEWIHIFLYTTRFFFFLVRITYRPCMYRLMHSCCGSIQKECENNDFAMKSQSNTTA